MDWGQKNAANTKCIGCKWATYVGANYICRNKYACVNNSKYKRPYKL